MQLVEELAEEKLAVGEVAEITDKGALSSTSGANMAMGGSEAA